MDDGSTDGGDTQIRDVQAELDLEAIYSEVNCGKGTAFRAGLERANRNYVVIQDADLEYDPREIRHLLQYAVSSRLDAVYGSRYLNRGRQGKLANYLAVKSLSILIRLIYGRRITDPCTCYKLFRRECLSSIELHSCGFELCQELNRSILDRKLSFVELPIGYTARGMSEGKKIRAADFVRAVEVLLCSS